MDNKIYCELEQAICLKLGRRMPNKNKIERRLTDMEIDGSSSSQLEWSMNFVADAVKLLNAIDLRVVGTWEGWYITGDGPDNESIWREFDDNTELLRFAGEVRDLVNRLGAELGIDDLDLLYGMLADNGEKSMGGENDAPMEGGK